MFLIFSWIFLPLGHKAINRFIRVVSSAGRKYWIAFEDTGLNCGIPGMGTVNSNKREEQEE